MGYRRERSNSNWGGKVNTELEIKKFIYTLSEAFPGQVKTSTLEVYFQELRQRLAEVDLAAVRSKLIESGDFFPTVKRILEVVKSRREVERALETQKQLLPGQSENYTEAAEFFKKHGVANFSEYLEKQKNKKGGAQC